MWFVARFPQGRTVGGCLLFGVVYLLFLFFFFLVGCSGVIDVFSVFGVALWFLCSVFSFAGEFGAGFRGLLFC